MQKQVRIMPIFMTVLVLLTYCVCTGIGITAGSTSQGGTLEAMVIPAVVIVFIAFTAMKDMEKTNDNQQKQIDDLKRELEEMKQRLNQ